MRALSNPEYAQFTQDEASVISMLGPGQSAVVNWGGMAVLVYIGPNYINVNDALYPDVYLSDVTDAPQLQAMTSPGFSAPAQTVLDALPSATISTIASEAAQVGAFANSAGQAGASILQGIASTAGNVAAGAVSPLIGSLTVPLVIIGIVLALAYLPKRS